MDDKQILKIRKTAIGMAMRQNLPYQDAHDFASFVLVRLISGQKYRDLKLKLIDYKRSWFGRKNTPQEHKDVKIEFALEIPGEFYFDVECPLIEICKRFKIRHDDRIVFLLHYKFGFNFVEIGEILNVTNTRVCQRITEIKKRIQHALNEKNA